MSGRTAGRIANAAAATSLLLLIVSWVPPLRAQSSGDAGDAGYIVVTIVGLCIYLAIGRAIVHRDPQNTIGWMLLLIPVITALSLANGVYATTALVDRPGSLPLGVWSAWLDRWLLPVMLSSFIYLFLLYPDGHLPSRRWRPMLGFTVAATAVTAISFALSPGRMTGAQAHLDSIRVDNPIGLTALPDVVHLLTAIGSMSLLLSAVLSGVAVVVRYRGAAAEIRQQIRWLVLVGVTFLICLALMMVTGIAGGPDVVGNILFTLMFAILVLGIPAACGIAILKYRLYDLDLVVKKTAVFTIVAVFITGLYLLGLGLAAVSRLGTIVGALLFVLTFNPVRRRARSVADRLVYGKRATPFEILSEFSERVGETYSIDEVLPRMTQLLAASTGATEVRMWLRGDRTFASLSVWPQDAPVLDPVPASGDALPAFGEGQAAYSVSHQGELLGAMTLRMPANDPMDPTKERLVNGLASQAGLALRNVRLVQDLRDSRRRIVAAQDERAKRLERNIHDGAQQQIVAMAVKLRLAEAMIDRDTAAARDLLGQLQAEVTNALENLRDLARGIYPPLLADKGLPAALRGQARKSPVPVTLHADGVGRYTPEIEAAVYFCSLEALNNVAKYAAASSVHVRLAQEGGHLTFEIRDDGAGFEVATAARGTGLQGMTDRLEAIGGSLSVASELGAGTTVSGRLPVG